MVEENWKKGLYDKILQRNHQETYPYHSIYQHYDHLWRKSIKLDQEREISNHILHLLEYENNEFISKKDYSNLLENTKQKIEHLQNHLQPYDKKLSKDLSISSSLSKLILDQKKILKRQTEELSIIKQELQQSIDIRVELDNKLKSIHQEYSQQIQQLNDNLQINKDEKLLLEQLKSENQYLTEKLKDEKDKAAKQLNEMNTFLEGKWHWHQDDRS